MQPYLFPYLGYWQMIAAADTFVLFDDVNYIKRGWINRNNILLNNSVHLFTLPLVKASQNKLINEINITSESKEIKKILKLIETAYKKAPYYNDVFPIISSILLYPDANLVSLLMHQFVEIFSYLDIKTKIILSSSIPKDNTLKGQEKILAICHHLNTTQYINAIGGKELYDKQRFLKENICLNFIKMRDITYHQFNLEFIPYLSFIDVLMFNNVEKIKEFLLEYDLV